MIKSSPRKLEYGKEYYERNKERILKQKRARWKMADTELRDRQRECSREHYHRNKEKSKARTVAWQRENRELVNAKARLKRYKAKGLQAAIEREEELIATLLAQKKNRGEKS